VEKISDEKIYDIFVIPLFIARETYPYVLQELAKTPNAVISQLPEVKAARSSGMTIPEAEKIVKEIMEKNADALQKPGAFSIIMGEVMKKLRGQIPGSVLADIVKREIESKKRGI